VKVRNPWGDAAVVVTMAGRPALRLQGATLSFAAIEGKSYRIARQNASGIGDIREIPSSAATQAKQLGPVQIGILSAAK